jgi:hypothetical protein
MKPQNHPLDNTVNVGNAVNRGKAVANGGRSSDVEFRISNVGSSAVRAPRLLDGRFILNSKFGLRTSGFIKGSAAAITILFCLLDSSCMSEYGTVLNPLGPVPGMRPAPFYANVSTSTAAWLPGGKGELVVATPTGLVYAGSQMYFPHLAYLIEAENGWPVRCVANHLRTTDEIPMEVQLPAGRYFVIAEADGLGKVRVPVQIASGTRTKVILQRFRGENDIW